ncbi:uncharacterized protein RHIMIDRAFT_265815 [Rhizopus microsporus ATCC 52813]|uniref:Uncharacterized protein n=1 Tax=Rhizopus microsporus ATCC 52813 TaxID=1340429 RepID=A0A2G4T5R0_RHIZD|nr:uncharacterized protein RHIMIDRAFT_265815 [Rhizopus microsporus ATCC 52813]PHZ16363.1 hypothetical protein RHIMIDRAFT_265815 [Rhizopus microsporus ATCC 52813]
MLFCVYENSTPEQPDPDVIQAEQTLSQQSSSTVSVENFSRFLQARSEQSTVPRRLYGPTITNHDNGYPLFRKIRLSAYFNKQRADQKLIQGLRAKFGEDTVFVMGNWSAPHARLLKKHRFQAFLIDECINLYCRLIMAAPDRCRLWNRDVAACLNYVHILRELRHNGMIPHRFRRVAVAPTRRRRRVDDQEQPRTRIRLDDDSSS